MRAKKSLGQNFLTSKAVVRDILTTANLSARDTVLEIGPGKGFLTKELLKKAGKVIAVEKDGRLIEYLQKKFAKEVAEKKLTVIHGDILESPPWSRSGLDHVDRGGYLVVANIPYYITGQILRMFLESDNQPQKMILMVQKEVAQRIVARDGKESILSISVKAYGVPRYVKKVPARYFTPQPKVDSAILFVDNISKKLFNSESLLNEGGPTPTITEEDFFKLVKSGFAHKRKTLANNLSFYEKVNMEKIFKDCGLPKKIRAEKLSLEKWVCLARILKNSQNQL